VIHSPLAITLYFRFPDILLGSFGMGMIGTILTLAGALIGLGIHAGNRRLTWYSADSLAFSVGALGSFAVMMLYTV